MTPLRFLSFYFHSSKLIQAKAFSLPGIQKSQSEKYRKGVIVDQGLEVLLFDSQKVCKGISQNKKSESNKMNKSYQSAISPQEDINSKFKESKIPQNYQIPHHIGKSSSDMWQLKKIPKTLKNLDEGATKQMIEIYEGLLRYRAEALAKLLTPNQQQLQKKIEKLINVTGK